MDWRILVQKSGSAKCINFKTACDYTWFTKKYFSYAGACRERKFFKYSSAAESATAYTSQRSNKIVRWAVYCFWLLNASDDFFIFFQ